MKTCITRENKAREKDEYLVGQDSSSLHEIKQPGWRDQIARGLAEKISLIVDETSHTDSFILYSSVAMSSNKTTIRNTEQGSYCSTM